MRAVRIFSLLALSVVFAVNRCPLLGYLAGGEPKPKTEKVRDDGLQVQSAVRGVAVQVNGNASNGDVSHHQSDHQHLKPREIEQAMSQPIDYRVQYGPVG
jgi:hypothetical protein